MIDWRLILSQKKALILPTETVYGLFANALDEEAVENVYRLKKRPREKAMNLNVATLKQIYAYSKEQPEYLESLFHTFLPGPLTIILKANSEVPKWINSGLDTVGFRVPKHPITQGIIADFGPLIGPSANVSGGPSGKEYAKVKEQFLDIQGYEDDQSISGVDSTIIDLSSGFASILRQGAITKQDILKVVPNLIFKE